MTAPSFTRAGVLAALALLGASGLRAQTAAPAAAPAAFDTTFLSGLQWRNVGPVRGGRSIAVAGSTARPLEYWFGATGGGLWKTTDGGTTWKPTTDGQLASSSVGAVAVCEKNPDVVYAGMGEVQLRGNIMQGDGVYRSGDGGKTWTHVGLAATQAVARIRVHPDDCDRVYVAALGAPYGPTQERGVFRSTNGGKDWERVLFRGERAGAVDLVLTPGAPDTMFATTWEVFRTPWSLSSGGAGSGIFRSTDGGTTWQEITRNPGLPAGVLGKIGVSVSGADPRRVWAIVEAAEGGVFRSDDGGATWTRLNDERKLRQRAFYYTRIYADPRDTATVYVLNVGFWKSTDGGKTFAKQLRVPHGDNHDLWIDPANPLRMVNGNDGGGNVSVNGGETWTDQDYATAQMYHVVTTDHTPYHVCGAQQDNSTVCVPSDGNGREFYRVGFGESGYVAPDPRDPNVFYSGNYGGYLSRFDRATNQTRNVQVWPENPMGHSARDIRERFQWTFPIVFSRTDPRTLYTGSQHLWRSTDAGQSWTRISGDLTRGDTATLGPSGGPITLDQTGVETYGTIFTIAPSPRDGGVIWTGSDDGRVHVTRDGGATWTEVTPAALPGFARISLIEASPHDPARAYLAANRYQQDDRAPYLFRTTDFGRTWTRITDGIGPTDFARAIREDPARPGLLYAGTEHGVHVSFDDGARWQTLRRNLPDVQVADLVVKDADVVIASHGRSFWVLDDVAPLRQLTPAVAAAPAHLFRPTDAVRGVDPGVTVYYNLRRPARRVTLEFLDSAGTVIRAFTGEAGDTARRGGGGGDDDDDDDGPARDPKPSTKAGMNRFVWNLRHPGPVTFPKMIMWAAQSRGPVSLPGAYAVRLTVDGRTQTQPFRVVPDPRLRDVSPADLRAQFDLAMRIRDRVSDANRAVLLVRGIRQQVDERVTRANDPAVAAAADALKARLAPVEEAIYQVRLQSNQDPLNYPIRLNNKIAALQGVVESAQARPTDVSHQVFDLLSGRLAEQLRALDAIVATDLPAFNAVLRGKRLPPVRPEPLVVPPDAEDEDDDGGEGEEEAKLW